MRLASEQQLTHACLSSNADASTRGGANSPSVEALMTLLWAIQCFEREQERDQLTPRLDAATEVRQAIGELDILFGQYKDTGDRERVSYVPHGRDGDSAMELEMKTGQKSLDGWRSGPV